MSSMKNQEIISKLNVINEEISLLEEVPFDTPYIEEKLEELRLLRHEYEKELHYDQITTAPADQEGC